MTAIRPLPSQQELCERLTYIPDTGVLTWNYMPSFPPQWNGKWAGRRAGSELHADGRLSITIGPRVMVAARIIWKMVYGVDPPREVDHKDGDPANDRLKNLRLASHHQNMRNKSPHRGKDLPKGVSRCAGTDRLRASIYVDNKCQHLGMFDTPAEAHAAYCAAADKAFGEFARHG